MRESTINLSHGMYVPTETGTAHLSDKGQKYYIWSKLLSKWVSQQSYWLLVECHCAVLLHFLHMFCACSLVLSDKLRCLSQERKWALILLSRVWVMEHGVGIQHARKFEQNVETRYSGFVLLSSTSYCLSLFNWIFSEGLI